MNVRRLLPFLVALVLGAGSAVLVACGDSGTDGGLPQPDANQLSSDFEDVQQAVDDARCDDVVKQLAQVNTRLDALPQSVDSELVENLRKAQTNLANGMAVEECNDNKQPEVEPTDTTTQETVPPETTETTTTPPETTTTEPPSTTVPVDPTQPTDPTDPTQPPLDPSVPPLDDDTLPPDQGGGTAPAVP